MLKFSHMKKTRWNAVFLMLILSFLSLPESWAQLSVVTYNVWGLPAPLSGQKKARMTSFCGKLKTMVDTDLVLLQEAWMKTDRDRLKNCGFQFYADRNHGDFDSGVMILSRYPIKFSESLRYSRKNGKERLYNPLYNDGERFVHKALLMAVVDHPQYGKITVATTHLASNHYTPKHTYAKARREQIFEAALELNAIEGRVIFGGDLNTSPNGKGFEENWKLFSILFKDFKTLSRASSFYTYPEEGRLDHLFARGFEVLEEKRIFDQPEERFSDHFAINTIIQ